MRRLPFRIVSSIIGGASLMRSVRPLRTATSHVMQKYRVMIHGQNLLTEVDGVRKKLGFFTNVFIEAFTAADAESRAIDIVRQDDGLADILLNADDDPLSLS